MSNHLRSRRSVWHFGPEGQNFNLLHCAKTMKKSIFPLSLWILFCGVTSLSFAEQSLVAIPVTAPPVIDGLTNDPAWKNAPVLTTFDKTNALPIIIKSVYTDKEIFFQVSFPDSDESRTHKSWVWDK
jgi:hypothetical protein